MSDGAYTLVLSGISFDNDTAVSSTSPSVKLADGTLFNTEVRQGSIKTTTAPNNGGDTVALELVTDNNNGRLRANVVYDADNQVKLGDLDDLSFDYYIAASDMTNQIPVIRLAIDADGDLATTGDRGELVFEWAYQGLGATTTGSWQEADLAGDNWVAWQRSFGQNRD
jgi:hypothetical protein